MKKGKGKNRRSKKSRKKVMRDVYIPPSTKSPRRSISPSVFNEMSPAWGFCKIDMCGKWGWGKITQEELKDKLLPRLKHYETMQWQDFTSDRPGSSHNIPLENIVREARNRLKEINQDDVDELFSLVITGERRVWGIKSGRVLNLLWWDPKHEICPATKSYT